MALCALIRASPINPARTQGMHIQLTAESIMFALKEPHDLTDAVSERFSMWTLCSVMIPRTLLDGEWLGAFVK